MMVQIDVKGRLTQFRLDPKNARWHCMYDEMESDFPLTTFVDGKRTSFTRTESSLR